MNRRPPLPNVLLLLSCLMLLGSAVRAEEVPTSGSERLVWMRKHLSGTVAKFEFTQGYSFRKDPKRLKPFLETIKARGFNTWDECAAGGIWGDEQFASLQRSIEVAGEVGLNVWATLVPPSGLKEIARWPLEKRQQYYYDTVVRFAWLAKQYPNFVAFGCDDFNYNFRFFTPEMMKEMAQRWRAVCPRLAFVPLLYYGSISESFIQTRGDYIDGIVFHFRANSYPDAYIPGYDPKNFDMYADVMRYELKRIRQITGNHPLICGIYIWYYQSGWGVLTPDEERPTVEHIVRDATRKMEIAHEYADGIRVYGLGIDHAAYSGMGKLLHAWQAAGERWGQKRGDPESHLGRWKETLGNGPYLGVLLNGNRGIVHVLSKACPWQRVELVGQFRAGKFDPAKAAKRYPILVVSKSLMPRGWQELLSQYAHEGGILLIENAPGWVLDVDASPLREGEKPNGDRGVLTLAFGKLSGVDFHYERRGFATRWRVIKKHPLTEGMGEPGAWRKPAFEQSSSTYSYLVHPVKATGAEVLIEVEHELCPYNGVEYARQGKINGVYPLLTVKPFGNGLVIRHYAAISASSVLADACEKLMANLLKLQSNR